MTFQNQGLQFNSHTKFCRTERNKLPLVYITYMPMNTMMLLQSSILFSIVVVGLPLAFGFGIQSSQTQTQRTSLALCAAEINAAPTLDGTRILPYKVLRGGLAGHKVAAVYAILDASYKRGSSSTDGWDAARYVGVANDVATRLLLHARQHEVAYVRAMSFATPNDPMAMQEIVRQWKTKALDAGANLEDLNVNEYLFDEDDDDDDDEDDDEDASMGAIVSPFDASTNTPAEGGADGETLDLTAENVDTVLNEVRPYLIADGGNVAVARVDAEARTIYLKLEGACGSCASSTVTMQMGVERVLKEHFDNIRVEQVASDPVAAPTELMFQAVDDEVGRLRSAIMAMGGSVRIVKVDPAGEVEIEFQGASKVKQGLELALLDLPMLNKVTFVET
jgi:Fe-S cluster biogenesis protein NfuA